MEAARTGVNVQNTNYSNKWWWISRVLHLFPTTWTLTMRVTMGRRPKLKNLIQNFRNLKKMIDDARTPLWDPTDEFCKSFSKLSASLFAFETEVRVQYARSLF